jgi:TonB family protein
MGADSRSAQYTRPRFPKALLNLLPAPVNVSVTVAVVFSANGKLQARIRQSSGIAEWDNAALDTCRKIRYKPALFGKVAVDDEKNFVFHFDPAVDESH